MTRRRFGRGVHLVSITREAMLLVSFAAALDSGGCAPSMGMHAPAVQEQAGKAQEAKARDDERILASFAVDPELFAYLSPAVCAQHCDGTQVVDEVRELVDQFATMGALRAEAAARLNLGALTWSSAAGAGGDAAYAEVMTARQLFAAIGDMQGIAYSCEWLGAMLQASGATEQAAEQYSLAYRLFETLGDQGSMERVLSYATGD